MIGFFITFGGMIRLNLSDNHDLRPLPFYLAMEQWAAQNFHDDEVFFTWRVNPTVIIGRHQCLEAEVDVDYCRRKGIDIVRRLSGGGCVYADPENLMISYVCPTGRPAPDVFSVFVRKLAHALCELGLDASVSGRNDILIEDRKVSGCAYYHTGTHAIVHTTMLFGANPEEMSRAITPEKSKLAQRGVKSVASRITTIAEHNPEISIERFREYTDCFILKAYNLTLDQIQQVQQLETRYRAPGFLEGTNLRHRNTIKKESRIPGVGKIEINLSTHHGAITHIDFSGDFLTGELPISLLQENLIGQPLSRPDLMDVPVNKIIVGLSNKEFTNLLTQ